MAKYLKTKIIVPIIIFLGIFVVTKNSLAAYSPSGSFDSEYMKACAVEGWARDSDTTLPIQVDIYKDGPSEEGGVFVESVTADIARPDLPYDDKEHGFLSVFSDSSELFDDQDHEIYIYGIDADTDPDALLGHKTIHCKQNHIVVTTPNEPYTVGAWYFTAWSSVNEYHIPLALQFYGRSDVWAGPRDFATLGYDPMQWGIDYSNRQPLIGFYNQMDQRIMDTHILQAASRGLSYFAFYWYWDVANNRESGVSTPIQKFVSSEQKSKIKFELAPIMLAPISLADWTDNVVPFMVDNYMDDSSYLTTDDGRPIIDLFTVQIIGDADGSQFRAAVMALRTAVQQKTGKDPVVLTVLQRTNTAHDAVNGMEVFDVDGYQNFAVIDPATKIEPYSQISQDWQLMTNSGQAVFNIQATQANEDNRPWYKIEWGWWSSDCSDPSNVCFYFTGATPAAFQDHLVNDVKPYLDQNSVNTSKMLTIYAWNEWGEGGFIEPNIVQGYQYLDAIQNAFGLNANATTPPIPDTISPVAPIELTVQ